MLYQNLEQKYGADKAHDMWTAVRTQQFINKHGNWMNVTFSSNQAEITQQIEQVQEKVDTNNAILTSSRENEYKELAALEKPSIKLPLIPAAVLVAAKSSAVGIAHNKIDKEGIALQQLMRCL